jgi:hypothetical protein
MIIYGSRLYGRVDAIPGIGHVATQFGHIDYVPLIPMQSWLVTQQSGRSWRGVKIPISAKSIFVAWGRAASLLAGVGFGVGAVAELSGNRPDSAAALGLAVFSAVAWGVFALTKMHRLFNKASYARACQLGKLMKLNDQGMAALAAAYRQPPQSLGFQPVMRAPAAAPAPPVAYAVPVAAAAPAPVEEIAVDGEEGDDEAPLELAEDVQPAPPPARAAPPLRGY